MKNNSILALLKLLPYDQQIEIVENEFRKEWTEGEKYEIAQILRKQLEKTKTPGKRTDLESTSDKRLTEVNISSRINEKIGKVFNESHETVRKRDKVFKNIDEKTKEALNSGKKSLNSLHNKIVIKENREKPIPPLPLGKFNHIVEDPPWDYKNNMGGSGKSGARLQYRTEPTNVIARIPVSKIAADDAVLYTWTTNWFLVTGSMLMSEYLEILEQQKFESKIKNLTDKGKIKEIQNTFRERVLEISDALGKTKVQSDALSVMHCHGFTPKYIITWEKMEKEGWGGYGFNNVTEHLLIGIRGKVPPFSLSEKTIVKSKWVPKSHSRKPEEMWKLIERCIEKTRWDNKKLEMNCRTPREGWISHGDQLTVKDIEKWQKLK